MSELPRHPDLDQLRRQARELLRAAAAGAQHALARLRAYSERVSLSAAQLTVAREYGFPSWAVLRAEAERRRAVAAQASAPGAYWSLGGAGAITTAAGTLSPSVLRADPDGAVLDCSLVPSAMDADLWPLPEFADVIVSDDREMRYSITIEGMSGPAYGRGATGAATLSLRVRPAPAAGCGWLDLRGRDGSACRLLPSPRSAVRTGAVTAAAATAAERELIQLALWVVQLEFDGASATARTGRCSTILAKVARLRDAGGLDPASELPGVIEKLCNVVTGRTCWTPRSGPTVSGTPWTSPRPCPR